MSASNKPKARRDLRAGALLFYLTLAAAHPANAADEVTLGYKLRGGERFTFEIDEAEEMELGVTSDARGLVQAGRRTRRKVMRGAATVLRADSGDAVSVRADLDEGCGETIESDILPSSRWAPRWAGRTATVTRGGQGGFSVECEVALDEKDRRWLRPFIESTRGFFPERPVRVGDRWDVDPATLLGELTGEGAEGAKGAVHCVLKGLRDVDGRRAAEVAVEMAVEVRSGGVLVSMKLQGMVAYDLETGLELALDLKGPLGFAHDMAAEGPAGERELVRTTGSGMAAWRVRQRLLDDGTPAAGAGSPVPGATATKRPVPPLKTAETWYVEVLETLRRGDFDGFLALHTAEVGAKLSLDDFAEAMRVLGGRPRLREAEPAEGTARLTSEGGKVVATLRQVGGEWRCDRTWVKAKRR